jgi:3-oxoacyl-[acyl-carrier-protein] synthase III
MRGDGAPPVWADRASLAVLGMGVALPGPAVPTERLLAQVETRFGIALPRRARLLADRLGIRTRHLCRDLAERRERPRPGHSNPALAAEALGAALREAGIRVDDLAYLIGHTASPACLMPPNIALVADQLGFAGPYLELRQACTGFANALVIARGLLAAPGARPVAIVGSETGSVYFDPPRAGEDEGQLVNLVQMGDGAAAIVLANSGTAPGARLSHVFFGQVGRGRRPGFALAAGGSDAAFAEHGTLEFAHDFAAVKRIGPALFEHGVRTAQALGIELGAVDRVIPHQANGRLAALLAPRLGVSPERVVVNADRVGNTGSAAIWLALAQLRAALPAGAEVLALGAEATKYMFGGFLYRHG